MGAVAVGVGAGMVADQRAEDEALARARAGNAFARQRSRSRPRTRTWSNASIDGSLHHGEAVNAYRSALNDLELPSVEGLDPVGAENYQNGLKRIEFAGLAESSRRQRKRSASSSNRRPMGARSFRQTGRNAGADIEKINGQVEALDPLGQVAYGANWAS